MRPVLYLDVDGVLAPIGHHREDTNPNTWSGAWHWQEVAGYGVLLNRHLMSAIAELDVEIQWATTWEHGANLIGELFDWPEHKVCAINRTELWHIDWKIEYVGESILNDPLRPFIWIDDHVCGSPAIRRWYNRFMASSPSMRGLFIQPESRVGITEDHIERIHRFITEL